MIIKVDYDLNISFKMLNFKFVPNLAGDITLKTKILLSGKVYFHDWTITL